MATHNSSTGDGFVPFFRRYAKSWVHAVAAAGMTAFGTLTIVHRGFALLALASYVVPPIVLYVLGPSTDRPDSDTAADRRRDTANDERATEAGTAPLERAETEDDTDAAAITEPRGGTETDRVPESGGNSSAEVRHDTDPSGDDERTAARATEAERSRSWELVDVPTETTLRDVCVTETGAVYAVGDDGQVLTAGPGDGDPAEREWTVVLEDGPAAEGENLSGVDATADGGAVWIAGDSGSVGRLEADTSRHTDYSAPAGITDNWPGVAVGGSSGDETILLINGSGEVLRGRYRDGECSWDEPVTPGGGSSLSGIALADASVGYCCDTNDGVFETTDGGGSFDRIGPVEAGGTLENLATLGQGDCLVSADDGVVHRYGGSTWTPERVGEEAICGIARRTGETVACDADGIIHERTEAAWEQVDARAPESLLAVSVDADGERAVAVGEDGTVVERR
ncbi:hypothetical protein HYG81_08220 [Natrinema zhouii]|uniref:PQQ-binding-like beta-propeller repeat protein n=1 Tax=Natrinema zhouii TaxID=1710539 RepID=A0A7D6CS01_9EURY|nr:hypothetical protein [Natrinema zhouii]QLK27574.1 hypothetical protein HYG81_08220 [Natrinema zhouii]